MSYSTMRSFLLAGAVMVTLLLPGGGVPVRAAEDVDPFPTPEGFRDRVGFWERVFSEWSQGQVVVHHLDRPELVYEIVDLPGGREERYTEAQREFVDRLRRSWEERLLNLGRRVRTGEPLSDADKELILKITTTAGTGAIRDAYRKVRTQRGLRERFLRGVEISGRYDGLFRKIFADAGLPEDLAYLPHVESSYQAAARSTANAVGVWQFTLGTGRHYLKVNSVLDQRLDPVAATRGAARFLADAYRKLGDWPLAITAYNHGVQGMVRARQRFGADIERIVDEYDGRVFGFASQNFYAEFLAARNVARDPDRFFGEEVRLEPPLKLDHVVLKRPTRAYRLAQTYGVQLDELASINPAWRRRARRGAARLPAGTTVWLPAGTLAARAAARREGAGEVHVVEPGETLGAIARAHGLTLEHLRELNGLPPDASRIQPGQKIRVAPEGEEKIHVVRRGETLSGIAASYRVRLSRLLAANGLREGSVIHPGQRLVIPLSP